MGLLDLKTDLKSLRYGKDRVGGGSSNQPYIQRDLPDSLSEVGRKGGPDFLLRGGTLVPGRVLNDVSRITQMFFDFKSPNGILFAAKQNVLASSAVNTKAGFDTFKKAEVNSELSGFSKFKNQVATTFKNNVGLNKGNIYTPLNTIAQSLVGPIGYHTNKQGLNPFTKTDDLDYSYTKQVGLGKNNLASRLGILLTNGKLQSIDNHLYEYVGGPGATLGIGRTKVKRYENTLDDQNLYFSKQATQNNKTLSFKEIEKASDDTRNNKGRIIDFRQREGGSKAPTIGYDISGSIETRVNLGNPGRSKGSLTTPLDKLNAFPLYKSEWTKGVHEKNDLIKFRIGIIDNDNPNKKTFIHFRAFIDNYSDTYGAEWSGQKFLGRGENFYRYNGFNRTINLGWTVAAQSQSELIPQYQKLNYLASSLAPDYSKTTGYMRGNLAELTVGGWLYNQPGIIQSMTLEVPQESPWEIGISNQSDINNLNQGQEKVQSSSKLKELPHIVKVTGFSFIPIHKFVPRVQQNEFDGKDYLNEFGKERYIALDSGGDPSKGTATSNYSTENLTYIGENNYTK
tara:strand:+ start:14394 stop:16094 length:1701 start_codon:yes stop_codon:yes gene_type:complete